MSDQNKSENFNAMVNRRRAKAESATAFGAVTKFNHLVNRAAVKSAERAKDERIKANSNEWHLARVVWIMYAWVLAGFILFGLWSIFFVDWQ